MYFQTANDYPSLMLETVLIGVGLLIEMGIDAKV